MRGEIALGWENLPFVDLLTSFSLEFRELAEGRSATLLREEDPRRSRLRTGGSKYLRPLEPGPGFGIMMKRSNLINQVERIIDLLCEGRWREVS